MHDIEAGDGTPAHNGSHSTQPSHGGPRRGASVGGVGLRTPRAATGGDHVQFPPGEGWGDSDGARIGHPSPGPASVAAAGPEAGAETPALYHRCQNVSTPLGGVENGDQFGIDWCSITGDQSHLTAVREALRAALPDEEPRQGKGLQGKAFGLYWPCGVHLSHGGGNGRWWLNLPGNACRVMGLAVVHQVVRVALWSGRCTRLDLMRDQFGEGLTLVGDVVRACEAGEVRLVRSFKVFDDREVLGVRIGHGVYLGSSKSARFVRVYDKGLEQGGKVEGEWVRFELQMRDELAHQAALSVFRPSDGPDLSQIAGLLAGAVDFRVGPFGAGVKWRRFPRSEFWERFCAGFDSSRPRMERRPVDLDRWVIWFQSVAGQTVVEAARRARVDVAEAVALLLRDVEPSEGTKRNPVIGYLSEAFVSLLTP